MPFQREILLLAATVAPAAVNPTATAPSGYRNVARPTLSATFPTTCLGRTRDRHVSAPNVRKKVSSDALMDFM